MGWNRILSLLTCVDTDPQLNNLFRFVPDFEAFNGTE